MAATADDHPQRVSRTAALALFSIVLAHTLVETARDALFLASLPPTRLPWVYALIAVLALGGRRAARRVLPGFHGMALLRALLLASGIITVGFWLLTAWQATWILMALYVWPAMFAGVVIIEFWRLLADAFTTSEAKTVFSRVGGGAAAGGLAGGIIALGMSLIVAPRHLLLAGGVVLAATAALLRSRHLRGGGPPLQGTTIPPVADGIRQIRAHPYLRGVFGLLLVTTVTMTLVDYIFKSVVAASVDPRSLATVFASASLALNLAGVLVQLALTERLVRWLGVVRTASVLPATLSAAAVGVAIQGGVVAALLLKTLDGTQRNSVHRTAIELLYVPMSVAVRASVKSVCDIIAQRGGQLAGSGLILGAIFAGGGERVLAAAVAGLSVVSLIVVARLREPYLGLFRETLQLEAAGTRLAYPRLNVRSIGSLMAALGSEDEREVLAAMSLLSEGGHPALLPAVILFHPCAAVVLRGLELFARERRTGLEWATRRLFLEHPDDDVRAAALRAQLAVLDDPAILESALEDSSAVVRAAAVIGLISRGRAEAPAVAGALAALRADSDAAPQLALARAIRHQPSERLEDLLLDLAATDDPGVRLECVQAMAELASPRFLVALVGALNNRELRPVARAGLVRIGSPALTFLSEALADRSTPFDVRLHIPRSISRFAAARAIPILLRELTCEKDLALRFKIVRGLGRLRTDAPEIRIDDAVVEQTLREGLKDALRFRHWHRVIDGDGTALEAAGDGSHRLLADLLADESTQAIEIVFRLLDLRYPAEKFEQVFHGLHGSPTARASSLEIIGHVVSNPLRQAVLALIQDTAEAPPAPPEDAIYEARPMTDEEATAEIIEKAPGPLRVMASRYAGEKGFTALRDAIAGFAGTEPAAFRWALNKSVAELERGSDAA
jgi:AAA family ATP:ADP antiporter